MLRVFWLSPPGCRCRRLLRPLLLRCSDLLRPPPCPSSPFPPRLRLRSRPRSRRLLGLGAGLGPEEESALLLLSMLSTLQREAERLLLTAYLEPDGGGGERVLSLSMVAAAGVCQCADA